MGLINLFNPTTFCACSKPKSGFPISCYIVFFLVFSELKWEVIVRFVNICGIVDYHCVKFLFISNTVRFKYSTDTMILLSWKHFFKKKLRGSRGRDRMVVGIATTYAISAYHHWYCSFDSIPGRGVQHYVIKFVTAL